MRWMFVWVYLAIGALFITIAALSGGGRPLVLATVAVVVAVPIMAVLVTAVMLIPIAVHEYGHYLAGRSVGMRLVYFQIGPLSWRRCDDHFKFETTGTFALGGLAGMEFAAATFDARRYSRFIAGGPIASVLFAAAAGTAVAILGFGLRDAPLGLGLARLLALLLCYTSLVILPYTLLPIHYKGAATDMKHLVQIRKGGAAAARIAALYQIYTELQAGIRIRDLADSLLKTVCEPRDNSTAEAQGNLFSYGALNDRGEREAALVHLQRASEITEKMTDLFVVLKRLTKYLVAYNAAKDGDVAKARQLAGESDEKSRVLLSAWCMAMGGIAQASGDRASALEWIERANGSIRSRRKKPNPMDERELEWFDEWKHQVTASDAQAVPN